MQFICKVLAYNESVNEYKVLVHSSNMFLIPVRESELSTIRKVKSNVGLPLESLIYVDMATLDNKVVTIDSYLNLMYPTVEVRIPLKEVESIKVYPIDSFK